MSRALGLFAVLAIMWWFWSGYTYPLLIGFGFASCLLVTWLATRMHLLDSESMHLRQLPAIARYWFWLGVQIIRSNIDVSYRILTGKFEPTIAKLPVTQKTDQGRVNYANSITLTPGTLSYELESDVVHVHAIHSSGLDDLLEGEMAEQVNRTEFKE